MTQEVQVILTLEVDALVAAKDIDTYIRTVLANAETEMFDLVSVSIKEENELYGGL